MKPFYFLLCLVFFQSTVEAQSVSQASLLEDMTYLKSSLEASHFDLYGHVSKVEFDQNYEKVRSRVQKEQYSIFEACNLLQQIASKANNAHTKVQFPVFAYRNFLDAGGHVLPFEVSIENERVFIRKNWSNDQALSPGAELISINGIKIKDIFEKIYPQVAAESLYFKNALIESFSLPRYYWQVFGEQNTYEITVIQNGSLKSYDLDGARGWEDYELKREEIMQEEWALDFFKQVAYLRPGKLSGDLASFTSFIDSAFVEIKQRQSKDLIIDLRNNSGGDDPFSDYVVSYLIDRSFRWNSSFQLKSSDLLKSHVRTYSDTTSTYARAILDHNSGQNFEYDFGDHEAQTESKRFKGEVYVMVNRHSYSQSTVAAAQMQDYGLATIVGEETAEHPNLLASIFTYTLPNTQLQVTVSKGKIYRVSGVDNKKGVVPDLFFEDHLLDEDDEMLEDLLEYLNS